MFGIGHGFELVLLLAIGLIFLGPQRLPEVAQMVGRAIRELRKASAEIQNTFDVNALVNPQPPAEAPAPPAEPEPEPASATTYTSMYDTPTIHTPEPVGVETPVATVTSETTVSTETTEIKKPRRSRKKAVAATPLVANAADDDGLAIDGLAPLAEVTAPVPSSEETPLATPVRRRRAAKAAEPEAAIVVPTSDNGSVANSDSDATVPVAPVRRRAPRRPVEPAPAEVPA